MSTQTPGQAYDHKVQSGQCPERDMSPSDVCRHIRTPVWLTGCMISMLQQYFGSDERIALERGTFKWRRVVKDSEVYIADDFNWDFENVGQRPALIVELAGMNQIKEIPTIGQSGLINYNPRTGVYTFATIEEGTLLVRVIGKTKLETWGLAWEAKLFLQTYADALRETYNFKTFRVSKVDPPVPLKEYTEYKAATIHVPFSMIDAWGIRRENLKVQSIDPTLTEVNGDPFFPGE
jgi:hypothetical protein